MKSRAPTKSSARTRSRSSSVRSVRASVPGASRRSTKLAGSSARRGSTARTQKSGRSKSSSKMTTDHEFIREWVESRGGHPATIKNSGKSKQTASVLRIDFPGFSGQQSLKEIDWDTFFEIFDERKLAFLYQEKLANGKQSRFNKLVCRTS